MDFIKFMVERAIDILLIGVGFATFIAIVKYGRTIIRLLAKLVGAVLKKAQQKLNQKEPEGEAKEEKPAESIQSAQEDFDDAFRDIIRIR